MENLEAAQQRLNEEIDLYYDRNLDGGSPDELFKIALSVSKRFNVNVNKRNYHARV